MLGERDRRLDLYLAATLMGVLSLIVAAISMWESVPQEYYGPKNFGAKGHPGMVGCARAALADRHASHAHIDLWIERRLGHGPLCHANQAEAARAGTLVEQ